jgi:hypothetical protein
VAGDAWTFLDIFDPEATWSPSISHQRLSPRIMKDIELVHGVA